MQGKKKEEQRKEKILFILWSSWQFKKIYSNEKKSMPENVSMLKIPSDVAGAQESPSGSVSSCQKAVW